MVAPYRNESYREPRLPNPKTFLPIIIAILVLLAIFFLSMARAEEIDVNALANAIYKAENSKTHPYGIMQTYKHTTPRQACINTIRHALRDWNGKGEFISFLGARYCPIGASNDPKGLNKNWIFNVRYFYNKEAKNEG